MGGGGGGGGMSACVDALVNNLYLVVDEVSFDSLLSYIYLHADGQTVVYECSFESNDFCGAITIPGFPRGDTVLLEWRVTDGSTPTANTGPAVDHTTGTSQGENKYNK